MINLYKANVARLFKNVFFQIGLIIAVVVTFLFTRDKVPVFFLTGRSANDIMTFISCAMIFFFGIFAPLYLGAEYADGTFRNKLIVGYTQLQVYVANLLALITGEITMILVWFITGIIAGAEVNSALITALVVEIFAFAAWLAFLTFVGLRCKKTMSSVIWAMAIMFLSFNWITFGNALMMNVKEGEFSIGQILYNIPAMGQWVSETVFCDPQVNPGIIIKVLISLCIIGITTAMGVSGINKRDVN
ncbi:MAG: hypothetical protein J5537_08585 [Lachnospiraceae bacterium]|nr:hypothetical protein [Lachnospiraceae bacterium]